MIWDAVLDYPDKLLLDVMILQQLFPDLKNFETNVHMNNFFRATKTTQTQDI